MADYVIITSKIAKAWGGCPSNNYTNYNDDYCPTKSEIEGTFGCSIRTEVKSWESNELVASYDVYRLHTSCTCNNCYSGQKACTCNSGQIPCTCNNSQKNCTCNNSQKNCTCNNSQKNCTCNNSQKNCTCNNSQSNNCATNGCASDTTCATNGCEHSPACSCNGSYCICQTGQQDYTCGDIEEVQ